MYSASEWIFSDLWRFINVLLILLLLKVLPPYGVWVTEAIPGRVGSVANSASRCVQNEIVASILKMQNTNDIQVSAMTQIRPHLESVFTRSKKNIYRTGHIGAISS